VVTVVARESADVRTVQTLVIYKDPGVVAQRAPAAAAPKAATPAVR
jgi:hypothetical protein